MCVCVVGEFMFMSVLGMCVCEYMLRTATVVTYILRNIKLLTF